MAESPVPSPCVRRCTLDESLVCVGCYRSIDEITAWSSLDTVARREVLVRVAQRRQVLTTR